MNKTKIMYGLKLKESKDILQYETCNLGQDAEFSTDIEHSLTEDGQKDWLVDDLDTALYAMFHSSPYYNANYETPVNNFNPEALEIIEVEVIMTEKPIKLEFVKIKLKEEYNTIGQIPIYGTTGYKDIRYMKGEIGYAIDKGDHFRIVQLTGVLCNVSNQCSFHKEHFEIIN